MIQRGSFGPIGFSFGYAKLVAICAEPGLVGHWKLQGDCRDSSGHGNDGVNHGVDLEHGAFDGAQSYIEIPGKRFAQAWEKVISRFVLGLYTEKELDDIVGDVIDKYDPAQRRGITLTVNSSAGGYQSQGTDRHVHFGIDNARDRLARLRPPESHQQLHQQLDDRVQGPSVCGYVQMQRIRTDWCHVYRYDGGEQWTDCGRVGDAGRLAWAHDRSQR